MRGGEGEAVRGAKEARRPRLGPQRRGVHSLTAVPPRVPRVPTDKQKSSPPVIHRDQPRFAGAALWAKSWHLRIQRQWLLLKHAQAFLPATSEADNAHGVYQLLDASLDEYIRKM